MWYYELAQSPHVRHPVLKISLSVKVAAVVAYILLMFSFLKFWLSGHNRKRIFPTWCAVDPVLLLYPKLATEYTAS